MCANASENTMEYDSVKVEFENIESRASVFQNTKVVPFDRSYFHVLKKVIPEIKTDYFWFFASFTDLRWFSHRNFVPTNDHMQVWYTTHPMGGLNKEGNVLLVPTNAFKAQIDKMEKLSDFENIEYNADPILYQKPMSKTYFKLDDPFKDTRQWTWLINDNLQELKLPNFYPSFWEDEYVYTWGKTNDVMLLTNVVDWTKHKNYDLTYDVKKLDVFEIPGKSKLAYTVNAGRCKTGYFWAVPPGTKAEDLDMSFQPDRTCQPCHYGFGNDIYVLNRKLCINVKNPGLDESLVKDVNV